MGIKPAKLNVGDVVATVSLSWGGAGSCHAAHHDVRPTDLRHAGMKF